MTYIYRKYKGFAAAILTVFILCAVLSGCAAKEAPAEPGAPSEEPASSAAQEGTSVQAPSEAPYPDGPSEELPQRTSADLDVFELVKEKKPAAGGILETRSYIFPDGISIEWGRLTGTEEPCRVFEETLSRGRAVYTRKTWWRDHELAPGSIPDGWIFIEGDAEKGDESFLLFTPRFYRLRENGALQAVDPRNGSLDVSQTKSGLALTMESMAVPSGCCCDYMVMRGPEPLTVFDEAAFDFWMPFDNKGVWRWAFDGYYFQADPSYIPSGDGVYTNLPSCYVAGSLEAGLYTYDCAEKLLLCLLHTMTEQVCERGYLESEAVSSWLMNDYGIDGAYYDTRFNSDFAEHCIRLYAKTGAAFLTGYLDRYMDYYTGFAQSCGWKPEGGEGIFVPDYWIAKDHRTPHTALNHQLAEMSVLYKLSGILERPELAELSDRMLAAIETTAERWIMPDDNLEYAILRDGTFGFTDYPLLTYNDLFDMQKLLEEKKGARSEKLDLLMEHKKLWMDRNGVKGYRQ